MAAQTPLNPLNPLNQPEPMNIDYNILASSVDGALTVNSLTQYLFWVGFIAMASGTAFFWLSKNDVLPKYRSTLIVSGLITGIAAYHYYRMAAVYDPEAGIFPTEYRYIDWIITTPLMLIKFPMLLGLGAQGKKWLTQLVVLDLVMIVTAYIAEVSEVSSGPWWTFFIVAVIAWAAIIGLLFSGIGGAIEGAAPPIAKGLRQMRLFIAIGWIIYPVGFLLALSGNESIREIAYNIADVINKVGFGLVAYYAVKAMSAAEQKAA